MLCPVYETVATRVNLPMPCAVTTPSETLAPVEPISVTVQAICACVSAYSYPLSDGVYFSPDFMLAADVIVGVSAAMSCRTESSSSAACRSA